MDSNHPGLFLVYSLVNNLPFEVCKNDLRILKIFQLLRWKKSAASEKYLAISKQYWNNITGPEIKE